MSLIYRIVTDDNSIAGPDFDSWEAATEYKNEYQIPGLVMSSDEMPDNFQSNPEPQEMTTAWMRKMERNQ